MITDTLTHRVAAPEGQLPRRESWVARVLRTVGLVTLTLVGGADLLRHHDIGRPVGTATR